MKIYGPYTAKNGRKHVIIIYDCGKRKTVSYPKFLIEKRLGRKLKDNETVDHIDGDFTNDDISNLQVLDRSIHAKLDAKRTRASVKCTWCDVEFELSSDQRRPSSKKAGPFCSRVCSGKYGASVQNGRSERLERQKFNIINYTWKDLSPWWNADTPSSKVGSRKGV